MLAKIFNKYILASSSVLFLFLKLFLINWMLPAHHQTVVRKRWQRKKNIVEHLAAIETYLSQLELVETKSELI